MSGKSSTSMKQSDLTRWTKKSNEPRTSKPTAKSRQLAAAGIKQTNVSTHKAKQTKMESYVEEKQEETNQSDEVDDDGGEEHKQSDTVASHNQTGSVDEDGDEIMADVGTHVEVTTSAPSVEDATAVPPPKKRQKRSRGSTKKQSSTPSVEPVILVASRHSSRAAAKIATEKMHSVLAEEEPGSDGSDYDDAEERDAERAAVRRAVAEAAAAHDRLFFFAKPQKKRARETEDDEENGEETKEEDGDSAEAEEYPDDIDEDDMADHMVDLSSLLPAYKSMPKGYRPPRPPSPPVDPVEARRARLLDRDGMVCLTQDPQPIKIRSNDLEAYPLNIDMSLSSTTTASVLFMLDAAVESGNWETEAAVLGTALSMRNPSLDINAVLPKCGEPIMFRIVRAYLQEGPRSKHVKPITTNCDHLLDRMRTELNVHATNEKEQNLLHILTAQESYPSVVGRWYRRGDRRFYSPNSDFVKSALKILSKRGAVWHIKDREGRLPLLEFGKNRSLDLTSDETLDVIFPNCENPAFELMDIKDETGSTVLHRIFERSQSEFIIRVAERLIRRPQELRLLDLTLPNLKGEILLAAIDRAQANSHTQWKANNRGDSSAGERSLEAEQSRQEIPRKIRLAWHSAVAASRPLIETPLIPVLANIVMEYTIEGKPSDLNMPRAVTKWFICIRVPRLHQPHHPAWMNHHHTSSHRSYVYECHEGDSLAQLIQHVRRDGLVPEPHEIILTELYGKVDDRKTRIRSNIPLLTHRTSTRSSLRNQVVDLHAPTYFLPPAPVAVPAAGAPAAANAAAGLHALHEVFDNVNDDDEMM